MRDIAGPSGFPALADAAREAGHPVVEIPYERGSQAFPETPIPAGACVVSYGPHEFARAVKKAHAGSWQPCTYHRTERLSYSAYSPHLGDLLLNDDFVLLPFGEVVRRRPKAFGGEIFLKPDAVTKAFTGLTIPEEKFDEEVNALRQISHVDDELLCVVARPKPIEGEFRFVIADGQVVTGSEYRWDNRLDIRLDVHPVCEAVAQEVARREWQADTVYVCDVALINDRSEGRVIELNSFTCAGLYACSTPKIVEAVGRSAWREYLGDPAS
jgi:hypothetical protein